MKKRSLTGALLAAGLSVGVTQAQADANYFDQALNIEEQVAYALVESVLSLIGMDVEHRGACSGKYRWGVAVGNFDISLGPGFSVEVSEGTAVASVDDVHFYAEIQKPYDPLMLTKGSKIVVHQDKSIGSNQLGNTDVGTPQPFEGFFAYDIYGAIMYGEAAVALDGDPFDEKVIKDFWTPEVVKGDDNGQHRILDEGYELINKQGYPRAKWDQNSTLWRSNGGNGYISITKTLIAPDPVNSGCTIELTALVGNLGAGFQTINGEVSLQDTSTP